MPTHHLAQLNVARALAPLDDARMSGFVERLAAINALADGAPGFVWRLQTEEGDATAIRAFPDDELLIVNLSVWEGIEPLRAFVYQGEHAAALRRRRAWFAPMRDAFVALWWVPAGHRPTVAEAAARLARLRDDGPSADAFGFARPFPPPCAGHEHA
jgi:hypothetical protein